MRLLWLPVVTLAVLAGGASASAESPAEIVFVSTRSGTHELYSISPSGRSGGRLVPVADGAADFDPSWSWDGRKLAYLHRPGGDDKRLVVREIGGTTRVFHPVPCIFRPSWSPDGRHIVCMSDSITWVYDTALGDTVDLVLEDEGAGDASKWGAVWSPDGARLAFWFDSGALAFYNFSTHMITLSRRFKNPGFLYVRNLAWSGDGTRLAFTGVCERRCRSGIYVFRSDGSGLRWLVSGDSPAWSPDARRIAFAAKRRGNVDIYTIGVDGRELRRLTSHPARDFSPTWRPTQKSD